MNQTPIFIFDKTEKLQVVLRVETGLPYYSPIHNNQIFNADTTAQAQSENSLTFAVPANDPKAAFVVEGNLAAFKDLDGNLQVFEIRIIDDYHDKELYKQPYGVHIGQAQLSDDFVENVTLTNVDAETALNDVLNAGSSDWQVGNVDSLGSFSLTITRVSVLAALAQLVQTWGGEITFRVEISGNAISGKYIDWSTTIGADRGKRFEYGKDVLIIQKTADTSNLKTALYGYGQSDANGNRVTFADVVWSKSNGDPVDKPQGQTWVGDPNALAIWGRDNGTKHRFGLYDGSNLTDPVALINATWANVLNQNTPLVSYQMSVVTLEQLTGLSHEEIRLGDTVRVIDREYNPALRVTARILEYNRDLIDPLNSTVILGNFLPTLADSQKQVTTIQTTINDNSGGWSNPIITDTNFPDTQPPAPTNFAASGGFKDIMLTWDYDTTSYIAAYEVYASQTPGFVPDSTNMVWRGKAGGYVLKADTNQQWYFELRAINTHGTASEYTSQITAQTVQINGDVDIQEETITNNLIAENANIDGAKIADATIVNAKIANLDASKVTTGVIIAARIDVSNANNLNSNPTCDSKIGGYSAGSYVSDGSAPNGQALSQNQRDIYYGSSFVVSPGEVFYVGGWAKNVAGASQQFIFGVRFTHSDGSYSWIPGATALPGTSGWQFVQGTCTAPTDATAGLVWFQINASSSFDTWYFANSFARRASMITWDIAKGGTLTLGGSNGQNGELMILDSNGETIVDMGYNSTGASVLSVGTIISPSVYNVNEDDINISVTNNINDALSQIPPLNNGTATLTFQNDISENLEIANYLGDGTIEIDLNGHTLNGNVYVHGCAPQYINIKNGTINGDGQTGTNSNAVIEVDRCTYVRMDSVVVYGNNQASYAFYAHAGSNMYCSACEGYDVTDSVICAATDGRATCDTCKGLSSSRGLHAFNGGKILATGTQPGGSTSNVLGGSGEVWPSGGVTVDLGSATPPAAPSTTKSWGSTGWNGWSSIYSSWQNDGVKQGTWGYGQRTGYWFFGSSPSSAVTGKTISSMRVKVTRASNGGYSSAVGVEIRSHNYATQPSGQPSDLNLSSYSTTVNLAWGQSAWVTLPSSFFADFESGTAKGIGIYTTSTSGSKYAVMTNSATLEITYK